MESENEGIFLGMVACPWNSIIQETKLGRWEFKASLSQENKTRWKGGSAVKSPCYKKTQKTMFQERHCLKGISQRAVADLRHHSLVIAYAYLGTHICTYHIRTCIHIKNRQTNHKTIKSPTNYARKSTIKGCTIPENECVSVYFYVIYSLQS